MNHLDNPVDPRFVVRLPHILSTPLNPLWGFTLSLVREYCTNHSSWHVSLLSTCKIIDGENVTSSFAFAKKLYLAVKISVQFQILDVLT